MKKDIQTPLALLVLSSFFIAPYSHAGTLIYSNQQTQLKLDGNIQALAYAQKGQTLDDSSVEVALDGKTKLNDQWDAIGYAEQEYAAFNNDGGTNETKKAFVGLSSKTYGEITYGKQDGSTNEIANFTNVMPIYGGSANNNIDVGYLVGENLAYQNTLGPVDVYANYSFNTQGNADNTTEQGGSVAAIYNLPHGFALGAGYARQKNFGSQDTDNIMAALSYTSPQWYLAALYSTGKQNTNNQYGADSSQYNKVAKYNGYEAVAQYNVTPKLQFGTAYNYGTYKNLNAKGGHIDFVNYLDLNTTYNFNSKVSVYASYMINFLNAKDTQISQISGENQVGLGMTYYL